jgi:hypothetical protein
VRVRPNRPSTDERESEDVGFSPAPNKSRAHGP